LDRPPSFEEAPLPFPAEVHDGDLEAVTGPLPRTPLQAGVARTIDAFRAFLAAGLVRLPDAG
ncbi:MAG TPA: hypothetical protein VN213_22230, partial [Solirubrobacteraceae bacterium]|nr:hypothetical protein [Solirubrobacteraceae bacterium]